MSSTVLGQGVPHTEFSSYTGRRGTKSTSPRDRHLAQQAWQPSDTEEASSICSRWIVAVPQRSSSGSISQLTLNPISPSIDVALEAPL